MIMPKVHEEVRTTEAPVANKSTEFGERNETVCQSGTAKFEKFISEPSLTGAKNILGLDFYGLKKFFRIEFFDFTCDQYTVIITRRCFLLGKWFLEFLLRDRTLSNDYSYEIQEDIPCLINKQGKKNFILTDKASMFALKNAKRVNILDDISIHGETLKEISEKFVKEYSCQSVKRHVYMGSRESLSYFPDRCSEMAFRAGWCDLSQRIVELIRYLGLPYVSYVNSFVKFGTTIEDFEKLIQSLAPKFNCERFGEGEDRQDLGKQSYFAVEKNITLLPHEKLKCIRVYYSTSTQSISIIPYVIMKSINFNEKKIREILGKYITDTAIEKCIDAIVKCSEEQKASFAFNLVSCIASQSYGVYFAQNILKTDIFGEGWIQDIIGCLEMAFGAEISQLIMCPKSFRVPIIQTKLEQDKVKTEHKEVTSLAEYKKIAEEFIKEACVRSWLEFENNDNQTARSEQRGYLQLEGLLNQLCTKQTLEPEKENQDLIYAGLLSLINYCDLGRMNISCPATRGESYIKAGELGCILASEYLKERSHNGKIDANKTNNIIIGLMNLLENKYHRGLLL